MLSAGEGLQFIEGRGSSPDLLRQIDLQAAAYIIENCRWSGERRPGQTQFSVLIPGMRLNSRRLLVTTINPSLRA